MSGTHLSRRATLAAVAIAAPLFTSAVASAARPPSAPSVQQYIESIPTATGDKPTTEVRGNARGTAGAPSETPAAGQQPATPSSPSPSNGKQPKPSTPSSSRDTSEPKGALDAAARAGGGLDTITVLALVGVLALIAACLVALRGRRPRRR